MTTILDDPDIPLVSMNQQRVSYTEEKPPPQQPQQQQRQQQQQQQQPQNIKSENGKARRSSSASITSFTTINSGRDLVSSGSNGVGYRLAKRKFLLKKRRLLASLCLALAVIGLILMAINLELCAKNVYRPEDITSQLIKLCITISTAGLLFMVCWYHMLDVKIFMCDNSLTDWRLAVTFNRILQLSIELLICAIHPFPVFNDSAFYHQGPHEPHDSNDEKESMHPESNKDVYLSIPMFLRVFLLTRLIVLNSKLCTDACSQSLGALNRVHFDATFVFRSMMNEHPAIVLVVLMTSVFVLSSWTLHACESEDLGMLNAMWMVAITFLTVGYGDIVPGTYCGRGVAVFAGMFGTGCTALVVAVLAQKLELTRGERFVHNFVLDVDLDKRYRVAAANIVKAGWMVYKEKATGRGKYKGSRSRHYQRKLLHAIQEIREVKQEQRRVADAGVSIVEIYKSQSHTSGVIQRISAQQNDISSDMKILMEKIIDMNQRLDTLTNQQT